MCFRNFSARDTSTRRSSNSNRLSISRGNKSFPAVIREQWRDYSDLKPGPETEAEYWFHRDCHLITRKSSLSMIKAKFRARPRAGGQSQALSSRILTAARTPCTLNSPTAPTSPRFQKTGELRRKIKLRRPMVSRACISDG